MRLRPLNADTPLEPWPPLDPGLYIDFNPTLVQLASGQRYAVIRRDRVPPVPGKGTVWAVAVDAALRPAGRPFPLIADGEDPRAVRIGERVLVFYVLFERDAEARITGTSMVLAEFDSRVEPWRARAHFKLPKRPLGGSPSGSQAGWEKNWVPFVINEHEVGLIYAHDPWQVLVLEVPADDPARRFAQAYGGPGLRWRHGEIRGGTPPLPCGAGELVTFFHASEVVGSRKSYVVGACVFADQPPYAPLRMTTEPLLVAPYLGGMHRHGWAVAASVIFPLGCAALEGGWRLLCGVDDGEIAPCTVPAAALQDRLQALPLPAAPRVVETDDGAELAADAPLLLLPAGAPAPDLPLLRFAARCYCGGGGRTLLDVGNDAGLFMAGLADLFRHVEAVAGDAAPWRARNAAFGGQAHITVHQPRGAAATRGGTPGVARAPWPLTAMDEAGFIDLDLLVLAEADPATVLRGLAHTITRDRPAVLLHGAADAAVQQAAGAVLAELGYALVTRFPRSPGAAFWVHPTRRAGMAWFV